MVEPDEPAEGIIIHKPLQVALQQLVGDEILIGHAVVVFLVVNEQESQHLVHLLVAEEIVVVLDAQVAQFSVFLVSIHRLVVVEKTFLAFGPSPIEKAVFEQAEVFGSYGIVAVDDLALGDAACEPSALAVVGDGFLGLEGVVLCVIDHAQLVEQFSRRERRSHVTGKSGEEAFSPVLIKLKEAVAKLMLHGKSQIDTADAHGR